MDRWPCICSARKLSRLIDSQCSYIQDEENRMKEVLLLLLQLHRTTATLRTDGLITMFPQ